jgi:hypothetical protein
MIHQRMKTFMHNVAAFVFMLFLLLALAWVAGFDLDGLLWGHWQNPADYDHPENYYQQVQQ